MSRPILELHNVTKIYTQRSGMLGREKREIVALQDYNLSIAAKPATLTTIAGESGSGKTTLANLILGFISLSSGRIIFDGKDITEMTNAERLQYRRDVQGVFQDPFGVFNPFYRVERVFHLAIKHFHLFSNQKATREGIEEALNVVGLYGEDVLRKYPHQLSGGQRQRIMMARAYLIKPKLIVADEPVSMVDASLRATILDVMMRLKADYNISFLYITHDLSTAYQIGDHIHILYQGGVAEKGLTTSVIDRPHHPYVQLLVESVPSPDPTDKWLRKIELPDEEELRTLTAVGCRFYPRCPNRMDRCMEERPPLYEIDQEGHEASCYLYEENKLAQPVWAD